MTKDEIAAAEKRRKERNKNKPKVNFAKQAKAEQSWRKSRETKPKKKGPSVFKYASNRDKKLGNINPKYLSANKDNTMSQRNNGVATTTTKPTQYVGAPKKDTRSFVEKNAVKSASPFKKKIVGGEAIKEGLRNGQRYSIGEKTGKKYKKLRNNKHRTTDEKVKDMKVTGTSNSASTDSQKRRYLKEGATENKSASIVGKKHGTNNYSINGGGQEQPKKKNIPNLTPKKKVTLKPKATPKPKPTPKVTPKKKVLPKKKAFKYGGSDSGYDGNYTDVKSHTRKGADYTVTSDKNKNITRTENIKYPNGRPTKAKKAVVKKAVVKKSVGNIAAPSSIKDYRSAIKDARGKKRMARKTKRADNREERQDNRSVAKSMRKEGKSAKRALASIDKSDRKKARVNKRYDKRVAKFTKKLKRIQS